MDVFGLLSHARSVRQLGARANRLLSARRVRSLLIGGIRGYPTARQRLGPRPSAQPTGAIR